MGSGTCGRYLLRKRGTSDLSGSLILPTVTGAPVGLDRYMLICSTRGSSRLISAELEWFTMRGV